MNSKEDPSAQKLRGGYYTSPEVARWLCDWAIRSGSDGVLEPSCGAGAFLIAAAERLTKLKVPPRTIAKQLAAVEVNETEASTASARLRSKLGCKVDGVVETGDFFGWWKDDKRLFDAVV